MYKESFYAVCSLESLFYFKENEPEKRSSACFVCICAYQTSKIKYCGEKSPNKTNNSFNESVFEEFTLYLFIAVVNVTSANVFDIKRAKKKGCLEQRK